MDFKIEDYEEEKNFILNNPATPTLKLMRDFAKQYHEDQLNLNKIDYKKGFDLAIDFIDESPSDPDITSMQTKAWIKLQDFRKK